MRSNNDWKPWELCPVGRGEYCDGCLYDIACNPREDVDIEDTKENGIKEVENEKE